MIYLQNLADAEDRKERVTRMLLHKVGGRCESSANHTDTSQAIRLLILVVSLTQSSWACL